MTAADIVYTTVNLPPAFIGLVYEASIAYKGAASAVTAQSVTAGNTTGIPAGLSLDTNGAAPGSLRLHGTPTGAASTANGSGVAKSGAGAYTFEAYAVDSAAASTSSVYTLNLYDSPLDMQYLQTLTTAERVTLLGFLDGAVN